MLFIFVTAQATHKKFVASRVTRQEGYSNRILLDEKKHNDCTATMPADANEGRFGWMNTDFLIRANPAKARVNPCPDGWLSSYAIC